MKNARREILFTAARKALHARTSTRQSHGTRDKHVRYNESARSNGEPPHGSSAVVPDPKHWPAAGGEMPLHITTRRTVALHWRRDTTVCVRDSARRRTRRRRRGPRASQCYTGVTHVEKCLREIRSPASRLRPPHCHTVLAGVPVLTRAAAWRRGCEGCAGRG